MHALMLYTATLLYWYPQVKANGVSDSWARWIAAQVQLQEWFSAFCEIEGSRSGLVLWSARLGLGTQIWEFSDPGLEAFKQV